MGWQHIVNEWQDLVENLEKQRQSPWKDGSLKDSRAVDAAAASESRNAGTPRQSMHACSLSNELSRPGVTGGVTRGVGREEWLSGAEGGESGGDQERTMSKRGHDSGAPGADASAYEERTAEKGGAAIAWQPTGDGITKEGQGTAQEGWNTIPAQQHQHQQYHQQLPPLWSQALPAGPHHQYLPGVAPTQMMTTPASVRQQNHSNWVGEVIPHVMSADGRSKGVQQQDRFQRLPHQATLHPPQMTMRPPPHLPRPPDTRMAMKSAPAGMYAPMGPGQTRYFYNHMMSFYADGGGPPLGVSGYEQAIQVFHPTVGHTPLAFGQTQGYPRHNLGTMAHSGTNPLPPGPPLYHGHVQQQQQQCQPQHHQQPPRETDQPGVLPLLEGSISTGDYFGPPLPSPPLEQHSESSGSFGSSVSGGLEWEWREDEWVIFERLVLAVVATVLDSESDDSGTARLGSIDDGVDDEAGEGGRGEEAMPDVTPPEEDVPATEDLVDDEFSRVFAGNRASEVAADAVGVGGGSNVSEETLGVAFNGTVKNTQQIPRGEILAGTDAAPAEKLWVATAVAAVVDEGPACDAVASGVAGMVGGPQVAAGGNDKNLPTRRKWGVSDSIPAQREEILSPEQDAPAAEGPDGDKTSWCSTKEEGFETEAEAAAAERVVIGGHGAPDGAASDGAREEGDIWQQWKHFPRIAVAPEEDVPAEEGGKHIHESPKSTAGRANGTPDNGKVTSDTTDMAESGNVIADEAEGNDEIAEADNVLVEIDDEAAEPEDEAFDHGGKVVKGVDHTAEAEDDTAVVENNNEVSKADGDVVDYDDDITNFEDWKVDADFVVEVNEDETKADDETDCYVDNVAEGEDRKAEVNDDVAMAEDNGEIAASGDELTQAENGVVEDDVKVAKGGDRKAESDEDKEMADDDVVKKDKSAASDGDHVSKDECHEAESDDDVVDYDNNVTNFEDKKVDSNFVVKVNEDDAKTDDETDDYDDNVAEGEYLGAEANDVAMVGGDDEIATSGDELAQAGNEVVEDEVKMTKGGDHKAESDEDKEKADDDVVENGKSTASDGGHVSKDEYHEAESDDEISEADDETVDVVVEADDDLVKADDGVAEDEDGAKKADNVAKVVDEAGIGKDGAKADGNVVMNEDFTPIDGDIAEKGKRSTESEYDFLAEKILGINRGVPKAADIMVNCDDRAEDDGMAEDNDDTAEDDKHIACAVDYMEIDNDVVEKDMMEGNEADIGPVISADQVARNSPTLSQPLVRALDTASVTCAIVNGNHGTGDGSNNVAEDDDDRGKNGDEEISQMVSVREIMPTPLILPQPPVDGQNDAVVAPTMNPNGVVAPATNHNAPAAATAAPVAAPSLVEDDEAVLEPNAAEVEAAPLLGTSGGDGAGVRWRRSLTSIRLDRVVAFAIASVLLAYAAERSSTACARGNELRSGEAPITPGSCIEGATGFRALGWIPGLSTKPTLSVTAGGELVARRTDGTEVVLRGNVPGERSDGGLLCHAARLGRAVAGLENAEFGARFVHGQLVLGAEYFCSLFRTPVPPELNSADIMAFLLECDGRVGFSENGDLEIVIGDPSESKRVWSLAEELSSNRGK